MDEVFENLDKGMMTGAVFLDLSKAFDCVNHNLLLKKIECIGACDEVVKWFTSSLSQRQQLTQVGDTQSSLKPLTSVCSKEVFLDHFCFWFM